MKINDVARRVMQVFVIVLACCTHEDLYASGDFMQQLYGEWEYSSDKISIELEVNKSGTYSIKINNKLRDKVTTNYSDLTESISFWWEEGDVIYSMNLVMGECEDLKCLCLVGFLKITNITDEDLGRIGGERYILIKLRQTRSLYMEDVMKGENSYSDDECVSEEARCINECINRSGNNCISICGESYRECTKKEK